MKTEENSTDMERTGFIEKHGFWTDAQWQLADSILHRIKSEDIRRVRVGWGDQHGIVRGKTVSSAEFASVMRNGKDFQLVTAIFDTTNHPIVAPFGAENHLNIPEMIGLPDGVLVPDPATFHVLPWAPGTGWILADAYFRSGAPCPLSTRQLLRNQLGLLAEEGYGMTVGLEFEFYVFKLLNPRLAPEESGYPPVPPDVGMISHGYQYLTETRGDEIHEVLSLLEENLINLGLPVASIEDEWGPGQCEITFSPLPALEAADSALLFRTAVKQICRRNGYHASFMAVPKVANAFPSGWHLHQSLQKINGGGNAFVASEGENPLSELGMHYLGGLLANAGGTSLLTTPTINGYKRQRPDGFAPIKAAWARENRGAMLRVIGGPGDSGSRIENRVGEPCANPYLYIASQLIAGRDGIRLRLSPGEPATAAYLADRPILPASLFAALEAFRDSAVMRAALGESFHHYYLSLKQFEADRFLAAVTDWEHTEYFEIY
jgi:glutamine synthetase